MNDLYDNNVVSVLASFLVLAMGTHAVWMSPVIWKLKSNNSNVNPLEKPVTTFEVALLAGLSPLGGLLSPFCLIKFCDVIGRKKMLILISGAVLIATICLAISKDILMCYFSRFFIGIFGGGSISIVSIFLSEIAEDRNRGMIGCFMGLCFPLGNLYAYILGSLLSVKTFTLLCAVPNVITLLCFITFIPESPFYMASKGDRKGTLASLQRIRNKTSQEVEKEYDIIIEIIKKTSSVGQASWSSFLKTKCLKRGLVISVVLNSLPQLAGVSAILTFAGPLFDAAGASLSGDASAIIIGLVKVLSVAVTMGIIERTGRRPLLIISSFCGCIPTFLLGLFFYWKNANSSVIDSVLWLPVTSVLLFIIAYSLGLGVIPTIIMSELFPSCFRSKAGSVCTFVVFSLTFIVSTGFPIMNDYLGPSWCMWAFSLFGFLGFLFVYFFVPEIKGKNLIEVQEILSK